MLNHGWGSSQVLPKDNLRKEIIYGGLRLLEHVSWKFGKFPWRENGKKKSSGKEIKAQNRTRHVAIYLKKKKKNTQRLQHIPTLKLL